MNPVVVTTKEELRLAIENKEKEIIVKGNDLANEVLRVSKLKKYPKYTLYAVALVVGVSGVLAIATAGGSAAPSAGLAARGLMAARFAGAAGAGAAGAGGIGSTLIVAASLLGGLGIILQFLRSYNVEEIKMAGKFAGVEASIEAKMTRK